MKPDYLWHDSCGVLYNHLGRDIIILVLTEFCFYTFYIKESGISSDSVSLKSFRRINLCKINNSTIVETCIYFSDYTVDFQYDISDKEIPLFLKNLKLKALAIN